MIYQYKDYLHNSIRIPSIIIAGIVSVVLAILMFISWSIDRKKEYHMQYADLFQLTTTVSTLHGQILVLDEAMSSNVKLAALTGDPSWEHDYLENAEKFHELMAAAVAYIPPERQNNLLELIQNAGSQLSELELSALDAVRKHNLPLARSAVMSRAYEAIRSAHIASLEQISVELRQMLIAHEQNLAMLSDQDARISFLGGTIILLLIGLIVWAFSMWYRQFKVAAASLQLHAERYRAAALQRRLESSEAKFL